jgi:predicted  nucleic acid-binding Zn-ribbon protein
MFKTRLLQSLVAAAISAILTLLISRFDLGRAVAAGVITGGASFIGAAIYAGQAQYHLRQRLAELHEHVRALQRRRAEAYEEWSAISVERDRIAASFDFLQMQLQQLQVKSTDLWQQKEALSWNLTAPQTVTPASGAASSAQLDSIKGQLARLQQQEAELTRSLSANLAAKQRADASLKHTETELNQLQAAVAEQQSIKRQLAAELLTLTEQKQQLESTVSSLQPQVNNLEHYKTELNQFLQSAEPKRQQIETGSKTLHSAIEQLQRQIVSLHSELIHLEGQIVDRRQQKDDLDQELATLKQQSKSAQPAIATTPAPNGTAVATANLPAANPPAAYPPSSNPQPPIPSQPATSQPVSPPTPTPASSPRSAATLPVSFVIAPPVPRPAHNADAEAATPAKPAPKAPSSGPKAAPKAAPETALKAAPPAPAPPHPSGLPAEWVDLLNQLPEPEFHALRAIAQDANPTAALKQIAEANLTMPELLVDAINERAMDTIGDMILTTAAGANAIVAADHKAQVKCLIQVYSSATEENSDQDW